MTYVVNDNCIKCKYMDCVEVCPVDCFYEGENMLVIHPDECIDCGVCEPECPVEAIKPDTEPGLEKWLGVNAEYAKSWPKSTVKKGASGSGRGASRSRTATNRAASKTKAVRRSKPINQGASRGMTISKNKKTTSRPAPRPVELATPQPAVPRATQRQGFKT